MIYKELSLYFLIFFPTSYCFSSEITLKIVAFYAPINVKPQGGGGGGRPRGI